MHSLPSPTHWHYNMSTTSLSQATLESHFAIDKGDICKNLRDPIAIKAVASNAIDVVVFCAYFIVLTIVGVASSLTNRGSLSGYFLASRSAHWVLIGATLFASNIGSGHFIGLAGAGTANGIGVAAYEVHALFILPLLGWIFAPVYLASNVYTLPEYLQRRFGGRRIQIYQSCLALALYIFTKISADLYSATIFLETSLGLNKYVAIIILLAISALFTITGGMTAVIWTDFGQVIIMLIGAFILLGYVLTETGGINELIRRYMEAVPDNSYWLDDRFDPIFNMSTSAGSKGQLEIDAILQCGRPLNDAFHLVRDTDDANYPWPGIVFGLTIMATWYVCNDQVMAQRVLAGKDLSHAKLGCLLCGLLKILPLFIMVIPGMAARVIFPNYVACSDPAKCMCYCGSAAGCSNHAYTLLVSHLLPVGLRGVMLAVMVSALVSSLTSIFNSSATIFTMDLWRNFRKNASNVELMIVGRLFILVLVVFSILWLVVVSNASQLFHYVQKVTAYLAPPICAIFVLAIFWKRTNEPGAFYGLMAGLLAGVIRFVMEFAYRDVPCSEALMGLDTRPAAVSQVHYLYFAVILFCITILVAVGVSLVTKPPERSRLDRLTFWDRNVVISESRRASLAAKTTAFDSPSAITLHFAFLDKLPQWLKLALSWLCGIEHRKQQQQTTEQPISEENVSNIAKINESYKMRMFANLSLLFSLTLAIFIWAILW